MSNTVTIQLNGEPYTMASACSVLQLVQQLKLNLGRIAVEINGDIVPRGEHVSHVIKSDDKVEIIHAIGGG